MSDCNQNICENMTQIQEDLELLLNKILERVGKNIQAEKQAEYLRALEETKQVIERCKTQYNCVVLLSQNQTEREQLYQPKAITSQYCYVKGD